MKHIAEQFDSPFPDEEQEKRYQNGMNTIFSTSKEKKIINNRERTDGHYLANKPGRFRGTFLRTVDRQIGHSKKVISKRGARVARAKARR